MSEGTDLRSILEIMNSNKELKELGIEPDMHKIKPGDPEAGEKRRHMANDPDTAIEWIAGQVRTVLVRTNGFLDSGTAASIAEHDEMGGEEEGLALVDFRTTGPNTQKLVLNIGAIGVVRGFLDYEAGPSVFE
jgi:hypothetical protein